MRTYRPLWALILLLAAASVAFFILGATRTGNGYGTEVAAASVARKAQAPSGPPLPYIPNRTAARRKLGKALVNACHDVASLNVPGRGVIWNGFCVRPGTRAEAWKLVRCVKQEVNDWLIPRWDCQGFMQWETTELTLAGPCYKQLSRAGNIFPGIRTLITAWRRAYVYYRDGVPGPLAIRYIGGWQGCEAGYPS